MFDMCVDVVGLRRGLRCGLLQEVHCWAVRDGWRMIAEAAAQSDYSADLVL